jgi:Cytochrome c oxidase subunit IIa family
VAENGPLQDHPKGTLLLVAIYGVLFVLSWFGVYFLIYLRRGGVTP